ncbi:hypothetical protein [Elizabethkingia anophelis]|uniref:hypothetical protein n=1 Tax=Elizabethkingia anophelis TaxID=1117645 RepID=UPI003891BB74
MKRLEEIKNEVAKDFGYESFEKFDDNSTFSYDHKTPKIIDEISKRYAREVAQASLEKAAENALIDGSEFSRCGCEIDEQSIVNPNNIVLL